jgi:hypothetical protein
VMTRTFASLMVTCWISGIAFAAPGDHIRAGDLEFVPNLALGLEYHTNVYRSEDEATPAANLRIAPGANLTASGDDHEFVFGGMWELRKYVYVADSSDLDPVSNLDRFDEFSLSAGANLFKRNIVGFRLGEQMAQRNWTVDTELADTPYTSQFRNAMSAGVRINPGPALEIVPGATWTYDALYLPRFVAGEERLANQRNAYGPRLDAKYAFLPRTSLVGQVIWTHQEWQNHSLDAFSSDPTFGGSLELANSNHVKARAGIDGRFTEKIFAQALVGYGVGLYNPDSVPGAEDPASIDQDATGISGLLVTTQLKYQITPGTAEAPGSSVAAGYVKDFRDSFFTNYIDANELFAVYAGRFGDLQPALRYELRFEGYHGDIERSDVTNRLSLDVTYTAREWASFTAGASWIQRASSDDAVEFDDVQLRILANFTY